MESLLQKYGSAGSQETVDVQESDAEQQIESSQQVDTGVAIHMLVEKKPAALYYCLECDASFKSQVRAEEHAEEEGCMSCWRMKYRLPGHWRRPDN